MTTKTMMQLAWDNWHGDIDPSDIPGINPSFKEGWERCAELHAGIDLEKLNADLIDYRDQIDRLRVAVEALTAERDALKSELEIARMVPFVAAMSDIAKECDALKAENAGWLKSCNTLIAQRDALDKAARLALDIIDHMAHFEHEDDPEKPISEAIAALKAVL